MSGWGHIRPWCPSLFWSGGKFGAPDRIRTCGLCLRRAFLLVSYSAKYFAMAHHHLEIETIFRILRRSKYSAVRCDLLPPASAMLPRKRFILVTGAVKCPSLQSAVLMLPSRRIPTFSFGTTNSRDLGFGSSTRASAATSSNIVPEGGRVASPSVHMASGPRTRRVGKHDLFSAALLKVTTRLKSGKSTERQSLSRNSANDTSRMRIMG